MRNEITLSRPELYMALQIGVMRTMVSVDRGFAPKADVTGPNWNRDIEGAIGEIVFAKFLGVFWDGSINTFAQPDVLHFQVRTTHHANGKLRIAAYEADAKRNSIFVLVTRIADKFAFAIRGWAYGYEVVDPALLSSMGNDRVAAYWLPQNRLRPWQELLDKTSLAYQLPTGKFI